MNARPVAALGVALTTFLAVAALTTDLLAARIVFRDRRAPGRAHRGRRGGDRDVGSPLALSGDSAAAPRNRRVRLRAARRRRGLVRRAAGSQFRERRHSPSVRRRLCGRRVPTRAPVRRPDRVSRREKPKSHRPQANTTNRNSHSVTIRSRWSPSRFSVRHATRAGDDARDQPFVDERGGDRGSDRHQIGEHERREYRRRNVSERALDPGGHLVDPPEQVDEGEPEPVRRDP